MSAERADRYGRVAVTIHWVSVLLILGLMASGFRAASAIDPAMKASILRVHVPAGILLLGLTLFRIAWWWRRDDWPASVPGPAWQSRAAKIVHVLFYVVVIGMVATGIGTMALSGAGPILFGAAAGPLPDFTQFQPRIEHGIGARLLLGLLAIHVGAALYHQFVRNDATLRRMWPSRG
jgi:cytochrome b561